MSDSANALKQSLDSLNTSTGIRFTQGIIFVSVPPGDTRSICMGQTESLSENFNKQIIALRRMIKKLSPRFSGHFSIILTPDYDKIPQSEVENSLKGLQRVASGVSPYREKFSSFMSSNLNVSLSPNQVFVLDSGDALVDLLSPSQTLQSEDNAKVLDEALEYLYGIRTESILWSPENEGKSSGKGAATRGIGSVLSEEIDKLIIKSNDIDSHTKRTNYSVNRLRQHSNSIENIFEEAQGIALHRRPTRVELKKLNVSTSENTPLTLHSSFADEISLAGFDIDSYQFGLDEKGEFIVKKLSKDNNKYDIRDTGKIPSPDIKQRIISENHNSDLAYEMEFAYDSYPDIFLNLKQSDFLQDVDLFPSLFVEKAVSFHKRGILSELLSRGNPVTLPILNDSFSLHGGEEVLVETFDPEELSSKLETLRQCSEMLEDSKSLSLQCKTCIEGLSTQVKELSDDTNEIIQKI